MSRQIDLNKPLSEEDKEYLRSRARGWEVDENERRHAAAKHRNEPPVPEEEWEPSNTVAGAPFDEEPANPRQVPRPVGIDGRHEDRTAEAAVAEEVDIEDLTVDELKEELRARDLPVSGNKEELQDRLREAGE